MTEGDRFVGEVTGVNERGPTGAVVESVTVRHPERDETVTADATDRYEPGDEVVVEYSDAVGGYRVAGGWATFLADLDIVVQRTGAPRAKARRAFRRAGGDVGTACGLLEEEGTADGGDTRVYDPDDHGDR